jgi:hypothetical protein
MCRDTDSASPSDVGMSTAAPAACSARQAISAGRSVLRAAQRRGAEHHEGGQEGVRRPKPSAGRPAAAAA